MNTRRQPTLREVAERAGVSIATASYALNGTRSVGADVRERVESAASALGYRPDVIARGLKTGRSKLVTCIVNNLSNPLIAAVVEGANTALRRRGYGMLIFRSGPSAQDVSEGAEFATSYRSAGLLVIHPFAERSDLLKGWADGGRPISFAVHRQGSLQADHVLMADEQAGYAATKHLLDHGHRSIALLTRPLTLDTYASVAKGYETALTEAGIAVRDELIRSEERSFISGSAETRLGYKQAIASLELANRPTAIICAHNQIAVGALGALHERGISIPNDLSLISFDRLDWMTITEPTMTSIGIDGQAIGKSSAQQLIARLDGLNVEPQTTRLQLQLYRGGTVSAPPIV